MTGFIANAALGDSRVGSLEYDTLFAVGLLLFLFTLVINSISIRWCASSGRRTDARCHRSTARM